MIPSDAAAPGAADRPSPRRDLELAFSAAIEAVHPRVALAGVFDDLDPAAPVVGLAIGKAAAAMARELESWAGPRLARGLAITKDGHGLPLDRFVLREAGHPVPDARSAEAGRAVLAFARETRPEETLVVLLSGGASALTSSPIDGVSIDELQAVNALLLAAGAEIEELNAVRKHLGGVGGGRLAEVAGAGQVALYAISDVPGDRLDVIGSGPCTADPSRWTDALAAVRRHGLLGGVPAAVRSALEAGVRGELPETPKPGTAGPARVRARIVATNRDARAAALRASLDRGLDAIDAGAILTGEARDCGAAIVARAASLAAGRPRPCIVVAGGETTVRVRGDGRGGRSQELALAAALAHAEQQGWALLAAGSDGGDGSGDAAGAFVDGDTARRGRSRGVDAAAALRCNDSFGFFRVEGGVLRTGPTHTNVMDLALVHLEPRFDPATRTAPAHRRT